MSTLASGSQRATSFIVVCWAHWLCGRSRSPPRSALPGLRADGLTRHASILGPYQVVPLLPKALFPSGAWSMCSEVELANVQISSPWVSRVLYAVSVHRHLPLSIVRSVPCTFDGPCPFLSYRDYLRWLVIEVLCEVPASSRCPMAAGCLVRSRRQCPIVVHSIGGNLA